MTEADTIFARSTGAPPAAIAIVRISGRKAGAALQALSGRLPRPRQASLRKLHDAEGQVLDEAVVLWFPGPGTATGEDLAELHLHGGRAVIEAVEASLAALPELRVAQPGEFTRRAFANGRIDLAEAEGLADLLSSETELQRRSAIALASGGLSRIVSDWRDRVLHLSAQVESALDFSDEDDVSALPATFGGAIQALVGELGEWLEQPRAEALKEGFTVALAGPPNAGKSTLFNALVQDEAAITADIAGTTRDTQRRSVALEGVAFTFIDMAGLHEHSDDPIERIGIERAHGAIALADCVLWLGPEGEGPEGTWEITAQCDREGAPEKADPRHRLSAITGEGMPGLIADLAAHARKALPAPGAIALNRRQHALIAEAHEALHATGGILDELVVAEQLRRARLAFDRLIGHSSTEDMLDALFGRFCIGK